MIDGTLVKVKLDTSYELRTTSDERLLDATAVLLFDVFRSDRRTRAAFKFPLCCVHRRIEGALLVRFSCAIEKNLRQCLRMAQNVNPFSSTQNTPTKATEEKQSLPKDNHAVSKRYVKSSLSVRY